LLRDQKEREKELESFRAKLLTKKSEDLLAGVKEAAGIKVISREMDVSSPKELRDSADRIKDKLLSGIIVLGAKEEGKVMLTCVVTKDLADRYKAGEIISRISIMVGGKGGGRPDMAQGGGNKPEELSRALEAVYTIVESLGK
jgi:alanyl-tRNA synthetase